MPNAPKTPLRSMRIPDEEWQEALDATEARGETITGVVRDALRKYVRKHQAKSGKAEP